MKHKIKVTRHKTPLRRIAHLPAGAAGAGAGAAGAGSAFFSGAAGGATLLRVKSLKAAASSLDSTTTCHAMRVWGCVCIGLIPAGPSGLYLIHTPVHTHIRTHVRTMMGEPTAMSLVPSSTKILASTPSSCASNAMVALSVSISHSTSPGAISSPSCCCGAWWGGGPFIGMCRPRVREPTSTRHPNFPSTQSTYIQHAAIHTPPQTCAPKHTHLLVPLRQVAVRHGRRERGEAHHGVVRQGSEAPPLCLPPRVCVDAQGRRQRHVLLQEGGATCV